MRLFRETAAIVLQKNPYKTAAVVVVVEIQRKIDRTCLPTLTRFGRVAEACQTRWQKPNRGEGVDGDTASDLALPRDRGWPNPSTLESLTGRHALDSAVQQTRASVERR